VALGAVITRQLLAVITITPTIRLTTWATQVISPHTQIVLAVIAPPIHQDPATQALIAID
jgi:hypothetical protein